MRNHRIYLFNLNKTDIQMSGISVEVSLDVRQACTLNVQFMAIQGGRESCNI